MTTSLVTGGAGFIGSHIADHLLKMGHGVVMLDNLSGGSLDNVRSTATWYLGDEDLLQGVFVKGDIGDVELVDKLFERYKPDYVFHCAAYAAEGLSHHIRHYNYEVNVLGSMNLINASINYGVKRFVFMSSAAVYGYNAHGANEVQRPTPADPYGIAKLAVEQDLEAASYHFGLDYTIFRCHNVFGPRQNLNDGYRNCVGIFMRQALLGQPMTVYGDGSQERQFTYIDDVVVPIACSASMTECRNQVINIGSDKLVKVLVVATDVHYIVDRSSTKVHLPERKEPLTVRVDHTKYKQLFGDSDTVDCWTGIEQMATWAKTQELRDPKPFAHIEVEKNLPEHWKEYANVDRKSN